MSSNTKISLATSLILKIKIQQLSQNTMDIDEFLFDLHNREKLDFKPLNKNITLRLTTKHKI